ncbi:hypothetical protein GCM10022397_39020 [Flavivirga jejuensis]
MYVVLFSSCSSEEVKNYPVGTDFIENNVQVKIIDTFSIKSGTFKLDSLVTSNTERILLGAVFDSDLGYTTAQSYLQVVNSDFSIDSEAVYDSIGVILNYDRYYYGDTTQVQTYKVHRLLEAVTPDDDDAFYNTSKVKYDSNELLGELTFTPRPNRETDSLYIPISDALGKEIFDKILDNDINNSDDFTQFFDGFTIIPDTLSNSHILGFKASTATGTENNSSMRLFYTVDDGDSEDNSYYIDFLISESNYQFNAIKTRSSTIGDFEDYETIISSDATNDLIFTQAGTGISSRIEIPSIKNINVISSTATTLSAGLTFKPLKGSYDDNTPLKDSLAVYVVDHKNRILNQLTTISGSSSYAILSENDDEFDSDTYYYIDLGGYVEEILSSTYDLDYALMIQFIDYDKTINSIVIDANEIELTINYLNY